MDQSFLQQAPMQFTDVSSGGGSATATAPAPSGGVLNDIGGFLKNAAVGIGRTTAKTAKMIAAVPEGVKLDAQEQFAKTPAQQQKIAQEQAALAKKTIGTTNLKQGAKTIFGNLAQTGAMLATGGAGDAAEGAVAAGDAAKAGLVARSVAAGRAALAPGALAGAGNALANNKNVVTGALEGAGAGFAGGAVLPGVTGTASKLLGLSGKTASKVAADTADTADTSGGATAKTTSGVVNKLAGRQTAKQITAQAAKDSQPYSIVDKGTREDTRMNDLFNNLHAVNMDASPQSMAIYHNTITGSGGAASGVMRQILANAGKVNTSSALDAAKAAIGNEEANLGILNPKATSGAANGTLNEIRGILNTRMNPEGGTVIGTRDANGNLIGRTTKIDTNVDANKVFDAIQALDKKASSQPHTDVGVSRANVFKATKSALEDSLYKNEGVNKAVSEFKLAPEDEDAIRADVAKRGGSPELAQHTIDGINNAGTGPQLRSFQEPAVRAGQLADAYQKAAGGAITAAPKGGTLSTPVALMVEHGAKVLTHPAESIPALLGLGAHKIAGVAENAVGRAAQKAVGATDTGATDAATVAGQGAATGTAGSAAASGAAGDTAAATPAGAAQSAVQQVRAAINAGGAKGGSKVLSTIQKLSGNGGVAANGMNSRAAGAAGLTGSALTATTQSNNNSSAGGQLSLDGQTLGSTSTSGSELGNNSSSEYPLQNMMEDIERDPANATEYQALFKLVNPNYGLTTNQQNEVTSAQKAQSLLDDYMGQVQSVGGSGPIEGRVKSLLGDLGVGGSAAQAKSAASQRADVATSIAGALTPSGRPAQGLIKQIEESLPSITDSKSVQQDDYNALMQKIQSGEITASQPLDNTIGY